MRLSMRVTSLIPLRAVSRPPIPAAGFAAGAALWLALLVASPYLVSHSKPGSALFGAGGTVYLAGRILCHQRADRSFHAWGVQLPVCARCFGLYAAAVLGGMLGAGTAARKDRREPAPAAGGKTDDGSRWLVRFAIAGAPTAASVALEVARVWAQSPSIRCVAAAPLGFMVGWFVAAHAPEAFDRVRHGLRVKRADL